MAKLLHQHGRYICTDLVAYCLRQEPRFAPAEVLSRPPGTLTPQALFEEILEMNELLSDYRQADPEERSALRPQLEEKAQAFRSEYEALHRRLTDDLFPRWGGPVAAE